MEISVWGTAAPQFPMDEPQLSKLLSTYVFGIIASEYRSSKDGHYIDI